LTDHDESALISGRDTDWRWLHIPLRPTSRRSTVSRAGRRACPAFPPAKRTLAQAGPERRGQRRRGRV